ncbi:MAG: tetratricopeptide repeat protein [Rhodocyclaceae bacterium]|nr:tetratricopeptide repeat protein [Rhodocyclaceae bacterium]
MEIIGREPGNADAWNDLGNATLDLGHAAEAERCFRQSLALAPDRAHAHYNLARLHQMAGHTNEALSGYERALALAPRLAPAAYNRAILLGGLNRPDEAIDAYRQLLAWAPDHAHAWNNLGKALRERGEAEAAVSASGEAIRHAPDDAEIASNRLFALLHAESTDSHALRAAQTSFDRLFSSDITPASGHESSLKLCFPGVWPMHGNDPDPNRRLRIGFVSPDFREHPVGRFVEPLFDHIDPKQADIVGYPTVGFEDGLTRRLHARCAGWRDLSGLDDAAAARAIVADGIDILIDLAGHTAGNRLGIFARKPAPIQATWLGYLGGTGLAAMDWRLSDSRSDPPGISEEWQRERLLRLPRCPWCYRPPAETPAPAGRREGREVVFGSFNSVAKLSDCLLAVWARLLAAAPSARLRVAGAPAGKARERIAAALGIGERLHFVDRCSPAEYFALYRQVDIALDSHPYAGGTTTCDALWMGVPVVAWAGERSCSRSGASLLAAAGLPDWVASTPDDTIAIAAKWAENPDQLAALKAGLRARMQESSLMDETGFARDWQAAMRFAWREWCGRRKGSS